MIRPATPSDAAAICAFWTPQIRDTVVTFNSEPYTEAQIAEMITSRPGFFVAEVEGEPVGFATYFQFRGGVGYRHTMEHTIILAPRAQGHGLGRALMTALIEHARANHVHSLFAGVAGENGSGVAFHAALGFEEVARLPQVGRKFDRWMDLILMQKRL